MKLRDKTRDGIIFGMGDVHVVCDVRMVLEKLIDDSGFDQVLQEVCKILKLKVESLFRN